MTRPDVKKAYVAEMKQLVEEQLAVTLKECGYPEDVSEYEGEDELGEFLDEVILKLIRYLRAMKIKKKSQLKFYLFRSVRSVQYY